MPALLGLGLHSESVTLAGLVLRENRTGDVLCALLLHMDRAVGQGMGKSRVLADGIAGLVVKLPRHSVDMEIAPGLLVLVGLDRSGLGEQLELPGLSLPQHTVKRRSKQIGHKSLLNVCCPGKKPLDPIGHFVS